MDLGKDQSRPALQNTAAPQQEQNHVPEVIGRWNLRNREKLRKRKAEAEQHQTLQWQLGGQKKHKRQRTGKENERRGRKKQNTESRAVPESPLEKEVEKVTPTESEMESPMDVMIAPIAVSPPPKAVSEKHLPEIGQESTTHQEDISEYQETMVQNQPSEICEDTLAPEDLTPKMCHDTAKSEDLASDISPLPKTPEDVQDVEGCVVETCSDLDVPEGCSSQQSDTQQKGMEPEECNAELNQQLAKTGNFFPNAQPEEIAVSTDLSAKAYSDPDVPELSSHKTYQEIAVPQFFSDETIQETSELKEYTLETDQEAPGPEDCAPKMYQEEAGPEDSAPEIYQETLGSGYGSPELYQETPGPEDLSTKTNIHEDVPTECFSEPNQETEIEEKPKAEEPERPASPNISEETHPEHDIYSYVLF